MHLNDLSGLWLLGLLVPLIALYLLRSRPRRVPTAALWLWKDGSAEQQASRPLKKWLTQLPLLLQAVALLALALAASLPTRKGHALATHVAFVLDVSASMQSRVDDDRTRLDVAKFQVEQLLDNLQPDARVLLLAAGQDVDILSPFERDRQRIRERLEALRATDEEGHLAPALELAADKLRSTSGERLLVLVTDGVLADEAHPPLEGVPVQVVEIGEAITNVALTQVDIRSDPPVDRVSQTAVFSTVENFGAERRSVFVTLRQRNVRELLSSRHLQLDPGEARSVQLQFQATEQDQGTGLIVEVAANDGLPVDDRAHVVVPLHGKQPVVLVGASPNPWLERALRADPGVEVLVAGTDTDEPDQLLRTGNVPPGALVVYSKACPSATPAQDFLIIDPPPGKCLGVEVGDEVRYPEVTHWDESDARFRFAALGELRITRAKPLQPEGDASVLLWSQQAALMTRFASETTNGTLVGFDFDDSNWPLRASFVLFVRNLVDLAREQRERAGLASVRTGQPLRVKVPLDVSDVNVMLPDQSTRRLHASQGVVLLPKAHTAGFYYFAWQGASPGSTLVPANVTSRRESDPRKDELALGPVGDAADPESLARDRDLMPWFAALALLFVLLDTAYLTFARRRTQGGRAAA